MREVKNEVKNIVDEYFRLLEETIKKKMMGLISEQSSLFQELDKANNIISELKLLVNMLDNSRDFISSAQTIINLDIDKIEEKIKKSYANAAHLKESYRNNFHLEKGYEQKFIHFLSKLAYYGELGNN
jgi:hypothetical protein